MLKENRKLLFWIVGLGLLTYIWTIFFGFTYFDDQALILGNLSFLKNLGNIPEAFVTDVFHLVNGAAYYRPLLTLSFMFDAQISGSSPFFYHVSNVIIHIVTSCVVFIFFLKIKIRKDISFLFSIIFAVHPLLAQPVIWIPARDDSLLTLFSLLSFIFFINFVESDKSKDLIWHIIFFAAALFTKESGFLVAPLIVTYYLLFDRRQIKSSKLYVVFAWMATVGIWYILRAAALQNSIKYTFADVGKSIYMGLPAVLLDFGKVFFPVNLSILSTIQDSTFIWGFIALALVVLLLIFSKNKNYKLILFGTVWFFVFLFPSFIRPGTGYDLNFFEYRVYMPTIGLFIVLSEVSIIKKFSFSSKISRGIVGTLVGVLIVMNIVHSSVYRDKTVFWESAVSTSPHDSLAHKNLGAMYYLDGNLDKAEIEFKKALELNPEEPMAHNNLGLIYAARGDLENAEDEYKKELEINPFYDNALFNYGILLYREGKTPEAEKMWLETLKVNPDYVDAIKNLFVLYYQNNNLNQARYYYNELQKRGINLQ
jgi:tetratricopeptide (TPR) repeat protein